MKGDTGPEILDHIIQERLDITCITETWLRTGAKDKAAIGALTPPGYTLFHEPRQRGRGGGVGIVVRDTLKTTVESISTDHPTFECIRTKIVASSFTFCILTVYRLPPSKKNKLKTSEFFEEFNTFLADQILVKGKLIILGDFNFHLDHKNNADTIRFNNLLNTYGLTQLVKEPTHKSNHILDVVITRIDENPISSVSVSDPIQSDHKAVTFYLDTQRPPLPKKTIVYRNIRKINIDAFKEDIKSNKDLNGESLKDISDPATCVSVYDNAAKSLLDKHAPEKTKTITIHPKVEWYTEAVDIARKEKRKKERKWRTEKNTINRDLFIKSRNDLTKTIKDAKKNHFSRKITESEDSQKALFNCVDQLLNRTWTSCLPDNENNDELSNDIADFFTVKVQKLHDGLVKAQQGIEDTSHDDRNTPRLTYFPPISADDLKKIILKAPTKSCQLDPIPTKIVKECVEPLLPTFVKIINTSLESGTVPSRFKKAIVTPLIKKPSLDRNVLKNYRPVSNLTFLSKILEKVVSKNLAVHKTENNLEVPLQSAYRENHSTETALLKVHNDVLRAIDDGECVFLVLLDLSAAFDTIDHTQLQKRLTDFFGISQTALSWVNSYLSDRK